MIDEKWAKDVSSQQDVANKKQLLLFFDDSYNFQIH